MLILLIPVAWIGLLCTNQKSNLSPASITLGRIVMAILILFPSAYLIWVMFLPYYAVVASPILICAVILGARQLPVCFPIYQNSLRAWITSCIVLVGVLSMTFLTKRNEVIKNESTSSAVISKFNELAKTIHQPAVVFFTYPADERGAWKHEQVYNFEAANIDDQLIIRANDLGDKNQKLIEYYASRQPRRVFYKFDQKMLELTEMK